MKLTCCIRAGTFLIALTVSVGASIRCAATCNAENYLRDVKPLLEHKCYACHGALRQQGGLRVDTAASLIRGGQSGPTVSQGKPQESMLMDVLTGDAGFRMPPDNEGAPLTAKEIELVRRWITAGAPHPIDESPQSDPTQWWSYQPIKRPALPDVADEHWCRTEVDYFVAAMRSDLGLEPTLEAPKSIWMRRVFLDLIGLPPTRREQQRFLADSSPTAHQTVVDDLLSRPEYGQRWGRQWMDVWRYSDWYGSRGINEIRYSQRHIWRWRDWIVSSLNGDKGYDRMIREMLAGDEICGGDVSVLPATGYLGRNWYKFDRNVWMFDTVERTSEALLGLTLRCCRCHDHKYDPVTQEEYYRFRAFFEPHDVRTDPISALSPTQKDAKLGDVPSDGLSMVYDKTPDAPTFRFERGDGRNPDESKPLSPGVPVALGGEVSIKSIDLAAEVWYPALRDGMQESLIEKAIAEVDRAEQILRESQLEMEEARQALAAFSRATTGPMEPEVLLRDDFTAPKGDVWKTINGSWDYKDGKLRQSSVTSFATIATKADITGDFHVRLRYRPLSPGTYRSVGFSFDFIDKGNSQDVYTSTGDSRQSVQAFHRIGGKQVYPKEGIVYTPLEVDREVTLDVTVVGSSMTIDLNGDRKLDYAMPVERRDGKFSLWVHQGAAEFLELTITKLAQSRKTSQRRLNDAKGAVVVAEAELNLARGEEESMRKRLAADIARYVEKNVAVDSTLTCQARAAELAVDVLKAELEVLRAPGTPEKRAEAEAKLATARKAAKNPTGDYTSAGQQFPRTSTGRRTALADWITSTKNPRTARVAANHIWARHFGRPLVATPENFGPSGRRPTHPQLLDWLASELMASEWRMKKLHKKLVLSATYRMSTAPAFFEAEKENNEAYRIARRRDPENRLLWRMNPGRMEAEVVRDSLLYLARQLDSTMGGPEIPETDGEKNYRRSLYFRNTPNEKMDMLEVFDVADPNACYRRKQSIIPHQSLAMMNSGLAQDAARIVAEQLSDESDFVTVAFETVLARKPTAEEFSRCKRFLDEHTRLLAQEAKSVFSAGGNVTRPPASQPRARARENLVHTLFLHNDFVTIR